MPLSFSRLPSLESTRIFLLTLLYTATPILYFTNHHHSLHLITGPSMNPTLSPDYTETGRRDLVHVRKHIRLSSDPVSEGGDGGESDLRRGMLVTLMKPTEPGRRMLKRIVALEGDVVTPLPASMSRRTYDSRGRSVPNERSSRAQSEPKGKVTVPYGHVWVEGDNASNTIDSNDFGPVSKSLIKGIATSVVWPPNRWGVIDWQKGWERQYARRVKKAKPLAGDGVPEEWAMA